MSSKMSLNRPSYRFKIVFLVDKYNGYFFMMAYWKQLLAKSVIDFKKGIIQNKF